LKQTNPRSDASTSGRRSTPPRSIARYVRHRSVRGLPELAERRRRHRTAASKL